MSAAHCTWCGNGPKRQAVIYALSTGSTMNKAADSAGCNLHYAYETAKEARRRGCLAPTCPCGVHLAQGPECLFCRLRREQVARRASNAMKEGSGACPECHEPTPRGGRCAACERVHEIQRLRSRRTERTPKPPRSPRTVRREYFRAPPVVHHLIRPKWLGFKIGALS